MIADPEIVSPILAWPHTFVEIYHDFFSTVVFLLPQILKGLLPISCESLFTDYWITAQFKVVWLVGLILLVSVNSYGHVKMVSSPKQLTSTCAHTFPCN